MKTGEVALLSWGPSPTAVMAWLEGAGVHVTWVAGTLQAVRIPGRGVCKGLGDPGTLGWEELGVRNKPGKPARGLVMVVESHTCL